MCKYSFLYLILRSGFCQGLSIAVLSFKTSAILHNFYYLLQVLFYFTTSVVFAFFSLACHDDTTEPAAARAQILQTGHTFLSSLKFHNDFGADKMNLPSPRAPPFQ